MTRAIYPMTIIGCVLAVLLLVAIAGMLIGPEYVRGTYTR